VIVIKRKWFVSGKVCHNNNTGMYSYYNGIMVIKSWVSPSAEDITGSARDLVYDQVARELDKHNIGTAVTVELISLSRM